MVVPRRTASGQPKVKRDVKEVGLVSFLFVFIGVDLWLRILVAVVFMKVILRLALLLFPHQHLLRIGRDAGAARLVPGKKRKWITQ